MISPDFFGIIVVVDHGDIIGSQLTAVQVDIRHGYIIAALRIHVIDGKRVSHACDEVTRHFKVLLFPYVISGESADHRHREDHGRVVQSLDIDVILIAILPDIEDVVGELVCFGR